MSEQSHAKRGWHIVGLLFVFMMINYADKSVLGFVALPMMRDMHLSPTQFGMLGSAFYLLYSIAGVAGGVLTRYVKTKWILLALAAVWAAVQFPMATPVGFGTLLVCRVLLEIEHDAGKEARFEHAKQKAQQIELGRRAHEHRRGGRRAPQHHDPEQRRARADALQQQIARHLEQRIADEEHRRPDAVRGIAEAERRLHLQLREADVRTVDEAEQIADEQERHEPSRDLRIDRIDLRPRREHQLGVRIFACTGGHGHPRENRRTAAFRRGDRTHVGAAAARTARHRTNGPASRRPARWTLTPDTARRRRRAPTQSRTGFRRRRDTAPHTRRRPVRRAAPSGCGA